MRTTPRFTLLPLSWLVKTRPIRQPFRECVTKIPRPADQAGDDGRRRVAISGELEVNSALAQLANARYAPESVSGSGAGSANRQGPETLTVLTSLAEVGAAVNEIAAGAQRLISISTPDLEPDLYD